MSQNDFLRGLTEGVRGKLQSWRPGLERTGRVYRTFAVIASDEWWSFVQTRWTWDAGLLLGGILLGALAGGVPGALVGIVFVLLGSLALVLIRAPVRAIDFVNQKRRAAVREARVGSAAEAAVDGDSEVPEASESSRVDWAMNTLVLAPTGPATSEAPSEVVAARPDGAVPRAVDAPPAPLARTDAVRRMLSDALAERAAILARGARGGAAAEEAGGELARWLTKFLNLLQRALADPVKRRRMQRLMDAAGADFERQGVLDDEALELDVATLNDADVRADFEPREWASWSFR